MTDIDILCRQIIYRNLSTVTSCGIKENEIKITVLNEKYVSDWLGNRKHFFNNINKNTINTIKELKEIGLNVKITGIYKGIICSFSIYHSTEELLSLFKLYNIS